MKQFFHDWQRKATLITLAMACWFAIDWVGHVQDGSWELTCPVDWLYLRLLAIAPLTILAACLLWRPRAKK